MFNGYVDLEMNGRWKLSYIDDSHHAINVVLFLKFNHEKSVRVLECIGDSDWLERTTYRIIQYMLTATPSVHKVTQLLKILDSESITLVFKQVGK